MDNREIHIMETLIAFEAQGLVQPCFGADRPGWVRKKIDSANGGLFVE